MRLGPPRLRLWVVLVVLLAAQLAVRPWFATSPFAPDFMLVALLFFAMRSRPGAGAAAGFLVGLLSDAVAPTAFGAGAFALTVIGYVAGWLKAVVFADNLLVTVVFVFAASWLRDFLELAASGALRAGAVGTQLLVLWPASAIGTSAAAAIALLLFRGLLRSAPAS